MISLCHSRLFCVVMPRFGLSRDRGAVLYPIRRTGGFVSLTRSASTFLFCLAILVCLRGGPALALRAAEPSSLDLHSAAQVDGDGVYLNQLIQSNPAAPTLRLADAPVFGKMMVLNRAQIVELARTNGWEAPPATNWTGAAVVRISRRSHSLGEKEAMQMFTTLLQQQYVRDSGELELRFSRPWTPLTVPDEPLTLKVLDIPNTGVTPSFILRFELQTPKGESVGPWQAVFQAHVWRQIWVAHSAVKRGDLAVQSDLTRERRDVLPLREPLALWDGADATLELAEQLQAGAPLLARSLRVRPVVHRGQSVSGVLQDGALQISLKVEVMEDGAPGQYIRVRNPLSHRDLRGRVIDDQNVLIAL
jgi:flagellar basal body P-ring formation protein FlgA